MPTAREIMTPDAEWVDASTQVTEVARLMSNGDLGGVPVCDGSGHLLGMVTDRDLVVKVIAQGRDPGSVTVGELIDVPEAVTIGADDPVDEALHTRAEHKARRLPVIDGHDLIGIVSQADLARNVDEEKVGDLVEAISAAP